MSWSFKNFRDKKGMRRIMASKAVILCTFQTFFTCLYFLTKVNFHPLKNCPPPIQKKYMKKYNEGKKMGKLPSGDTRERRRRKILSMRARMAVTNQISVRNYGKNAK